ncbi:Anaphase-promoting complex subunit 1 [Armadillidium nasatum]|uniref:Anaphase-promoting complex subunit 1 n=1 Tax=Armadillidium nasatum TaxID=96803 RepID=A0A5N5SMK5_9CRUS|nr:Anaphase-promoting complex subunit 1 [Armadillidium nasatum]
MISCGDAEEFVPFGREHMVHHPGEVLMTHSHPPPPELDHLEVLKDLNTVSLSSSKDSWMIRKSKDELTEEELYFSEKTVVWSRGQMGLEGSKTVIKSMTTESTIQQALFATFYTYPDIPVLTEDEIPEVPTGTSLPSICTLESKHLNVYAESGEDFSVAIPFPVRKVWPMKFGILLERQISPSETFLQSDAEENLPVLYSLLHPLDEVNPVIFRKDKVTTTEKQVYLKDYQETMISTHNDPSICVLHSTYTSCLRICKIRRAKQEVLLFSFLLKYICSLQFPVILKCSVDTVVKSYYKKEIISLLPKNILGSSVSGFGTPITSANSSISTHTPNLSSAAIGATVNANIVRPSTTGVQQSVTPIRLQLTQPGQVAGFRSSFGMKMAKGTNLISNSDASLESEPLIPDICLEMLWSTTSSTKPKSAFLSEDLVGQRFICLLFPQVTTLKTFEYGLNDDCDIVVGKETSIPAKDAVFLTGLNMMVVVDPTNILLLYTGAVQICRLHLAGLTTLNSSLFKDFSCLNISSKLNSPLGTPLRRSSLLASSKPHSSLDMKFETALSPVLTERSSMVENSFLDDPALPLSSAIVSVRDATDFRLTLEHNNGNLYRVTLPHMWSSTITQKSILALKQVLPKELTLQLLNKWYSNRNSPGNEEFSSSSEWHLFSKTVLSLIGYDVEKLSPSSYFDVSGSTSPSVASKKFRATESGSESDWEYLLSSSYHQTFGNTLSEVLNLDKIEVFQESKKPTLGSFNTSAPLFLYLPSILFGLHLVYEEFKTSTLHFDLTTFMIPCLTQLAADLRATKYLDHYWKDFPSLCSLQGPLVQLSPTNTSKLIVPSFFTPDPPNLYHHLYMIMKYINRSPFPYIPSVGTWTKNLILLYQIAATNCPISEIPLSKYLNVIQPMDKSPMSSCKEHLKVTINDKNKDCDSYNIHEKIVMVTNHFGITLQNIKVMAPGLSLLLMNSQHLSRTFPPQNWPASSYQLVDRPDLVAQKLYADKYKESQKKDRYNRRKRGKDPYTIKVYEPNTEEAPSEVSDKSEAKPKDEDDGMDSLDQAMLALRWPDDKRVHEVRKMLCSSKPVPINITQRPGVSDHDFVEEQERQLYALCIRTMALPMGRGMFTLCTHNPIITETLPIPPLNLKGKAPPRGTTIEFPINEIPADMDMWPLFHNGVAAGLKIAPSCGEITSSWIVYNKAKGDATQVIPHAGFLMALGLNGHMRNFATVSLYEYLSQGHEHNAIGLLIGISATMRGTMDIQTTKVLSIHLECLLPPTSTDLPIPHTAQVAAILGVGLVYADTGHRHMAEVLLREIGRPPGPEMENATDRESYSLAAGLGLGMIMFGRGTELAASADLNLAGELHHFIEGGHRKPLSGAMQEKYKSPSYLIKEGDRVNINVTAPGATLGLGMIYFKSGNRAIADWMLVPNTPYMLDQVRPDFLLLRTIARGLILWDEVMPTYKWVEGHVPTTILQHVHRSGNQSIPGVDYESIHQAYYNILAGSCFVLGLKFAGSANSEAFYVLWKYTRMFANFTKRSVAELAGKSTVETCLCSILLSLSLVMAGTGDLEVLRLIRYLRSRVGLTVSTVGYGSHLAIHMALGFLFLGGGRFSLGTSNIALASLIVSCFPKFPTHSNDNRYHLQAFRHLYVLAAEPRLFLPVDVDTGKLRIAKILLRFSDTRSYKDQKYVARAPHMLPELSKLKEIIVEGNVDNPRYWPVQVRYKVKYLFMSNCFSILDRNIKNLFTKGTESWYVLETLLSTGNGIPLKLREGRFPYGESPISYDYKSSYYLTEDKTLHWTIKGIRKVNQCNYLSGLLIWQVKLIATCSLFLQNLGVPSPSGNTTSTSFMTDDGIDEQNNEKMDLDEITETVEPTSLFLKSLVNPERALALLKRIELVIDRWEEEVKEEIKSYLNSNFANQVFSPKCAYILLFREVPHPEILPHIEGEYKKFFKVFKGIEKGTIYQSNL